MSAAALLAAAGGLDLGPLGRLDQPAWLHALWLAPAVSLALLWSARAGAAALRRFASPEQAAALLQGVSPSRRLVKRGLLAAGVALLALALSRPQVNPRPTEVERRGRDVVFLVDVSRSMLARDVAPSRLERAKLWIGDVVGALGSDRVGLVAFAGAASVRCPLTLDRGFFRLALEELDTDAAPRGGTLIGDAVRRTIEDVFDLGDTDPGELPPSDAGTRDIILITDGDDQDSFPVAAAERAGRLGVRIIALSVGSEGDGALVPEAPDARGYVTFGGQQVRSRVNPNTLRQIALATPGGVFIPVGTGDIDLAAEYRKLVGAADRARVGSSTVTEHDELFAFFLIAAITVLTAEALITDRRAAP